jgi:hypothetical protein
MPAVVLFLILSSFGLALSTMVPRFSPPLRALAVPLAILAVLYVLSYVRVITDGPGFFPFYHPMEHAPRDGRGRWLLAPGDDHSPSGVISSPEQKAWAKARARPHRCILSTVGRRIVIRPDHFCGWTESWIGKRNYKFFLLFNVWGTLYNALFLAVDVMAMVDAFEEHGLSLLTMGQFVYAILALVFLIMQCMFVESHGRGMINGRTQWEIWNGIDPRRYDQGCRQNTEDVCGNGSCWCWWCPVSPWRGMTNAQLIAGYRWDYGKTGDDE